jgi:hypothetical protein
MTRAMARDTSDSPAMPSPNRRLASCTRREVVPMLVKISAADSGLALRLSMNAVFR